MAATENSANTLKINIVADANPAKQALADVGKAAIETKEKIEGLGKAFSDSTKRITDLTHDVNTLRTAIGQKSFGLTGMEDSARRIEVHLNNAISLANRLAKTSFANNGFAAAEKSIDRIIAKMREPIDAFRVKEDSMAKAEAWLADMRKKFSRPISVFEVTRANTKKLENLLNLLNADREKRGAYIKSEIELLREQRLNYRAAQEAAKAAGEAQVGMARTYKNVLKAQESLIGARDLKAIATLNATQGVGGNKTVIVDKSKHVNNQRGVHALPSNGGFMPIPGGFGTFVGALGARDAWNNVVSLQQRQARVSAWNLTPKEQTQWEVQRRQLMRDNKLISNAESESMMMAAASSLGHYDPNKVGPTVGAATKYAQLERVMGYNKSEADDIVKNYYGVAEARQVTSDVQKVLDTFKTVFNITTTTAGKISVADIETIMRNMGPGAATISDEGLLRLLAYAEQIKVAGKGSSGSTGAGISTVGTNVKMLQLMAMGKPSSINAKKSLAELGLMDDDVYRAYDSAGNLVLNKKKEAGAEDARQIAEMIFDRGDVGQVVEKVLEKGTDKVIDVLPKEFFLAGSKKLANAGAYTKELAQTDPVKWVEQITKLIDAYVVKAENRAIYFGKAGKESREKGESAQEFRNSLTDAQMTSAQTTFWAKTGLSQRVLTALSTFSNVNFQQRSKEMMRTAKGQKSADDLMKEQIAMGNLTLASEMLKKSIVRLTESFEPMTSWIGKAAIAVSGLVDKVAEWVSDYQALAGVTAGWVVMKSLISSLKVLGVVFDDIALKELKAANAARDMQRAQTTAALTAGAAGAKASEQTGVKQSVVANIPILGGFNRALNSSYNMVTSWADKIKVVIGTLGVAMSKCVTVFGAAWLAIDVASILAGWLVEFTQFGKDCKTIWDKLVDWFNNTDIVVNWRFNKEELLSDAQKKEIKDLEAEIAKLRKQKEALGGGNAVYFSSNADEAEAGREAFNAVQTIAPIDEQIKAKQKRIEDIRKQPGEAIRANSADAKALVEAMVKAGLVDAIREQFQATDKVRSQIALTQDSHITKTDSEEAKKAFREPLLKFMEEEKEKSAKVDKLLSDMAVVDRYSDIEKHAKAIESPEAREEYLKNTFKGFGEELVDAVGTKYKDRINDIVNGLMRGILARVAGSDTSGLASTRAGLAAQTTMLNEQDGQEAKKTLETVSVNTGEKQHSVIERLLTNENKAINRYRAKMMDGNDVESWAETQERMKTELSGEILSGKFDKNGQRGTFLLNPALQKKGHVFTEDDIDWTGKFDGHTATEFLQKKTYKERLKMFQTAFGSMFRSATKELDEAKEATEDARIAMDEYSGFYANSAEIRNFDKETEDTLSRMKKYGVATQEQLDAFSQNRAGRRAEMAKRQLYSNQNSDRQTVENSQISKMTSKQVLTYNYEKAERIAQAQYEQTVRQIQESIKQGAITQQEGYTLLSQYEQQYLEASRARYQDYYDDLTGYSEKYLNQKIEDWQDLGKHMQNMQDTIMDGFVSANEKWLDGDKNSWRDYCNDILKMWRDMALKMGYSKLLGGITEGITNSMTDFLSGAFDKGKPKNAGMLYDWSNAVWKWVKGDEKTPLTTVTQSEPLSEDQMATNTANSLTGSLGYGSYGWDAGGNFGLTNNSYANNGSLMNAGMGNISGTSSMMTAGSESFGLGGAQGGESAAADKASQSLTSLASSVGSTTGAMGNLLGGVGSLAGAFGANQETVQSLTLTGQLLNTTSTTYNSIQQLMNALGLTQTETQGNLAINLATLNIAVTETIQTFISMWTEMQAAKAGDSISKWLGGATASANGNIMTDHGPLPLQKYSNGGIAKSAQISIFGEGRTPEAYVPLPDGRSIPVTLNAGNNNGEQVGGNNVSIVINVTGSGDSTSETQSGTGSDGDKSLDDSRKLANAIKTAVKNEIYNQSRPGGMLYNR